MLSDMSYSRAIALLVCAALFIICDGLAANWGKNGSTFSLYLLLISSPLAYLAFGYLNQRYALSVASAWIVLTVCVSSILMGIFLFDDQLTMRQGAGLVLAICSVSLLF